MHRDLKPQNMLVTKWDAVTDTPTIKLADFGLAGIDLEGETYCGSPGYIAPEVVEAEKVRKIQKKMGIKTVKLKYTNAVDIWALGKILWDLVRDLPPRISLLRGKTAEVNTEPALRLIDRMMLDNPHKRPTASESLDDPWMATIGSSEGSLAQKRGRSPALSMSSPTSSVDERLLKAVRRAMAGSTDEGSTAIMMNALWSHERSQQNSSAQALCGASGSSGIEKDSSLVKAGSIKDDPREDNDDPQEVSPSMQDVVSRVLAELKAEGYAHCVTTGGKELSQLNISSAQIQQESEGSTTRLEFESFWDKVDRSIGLQSAGPVDQNITAGSEDASR
jgi:serine/threonine protein kinase